MTLAISSVFILGVVQGRGEGDKGGMSKADRDGTGTI